ncbi:CBS domain-containing protein [Endozoicomonadaceae bacterium StTr2]
MTDNHSPLVSDYMETAKPVPAGSSLQQTIRHLLDNRLTGAPVVDGDERVVGFVSEQDCIRQALTSSYHCDLNVIVDDVMSTNVLAVHADDTIVTLAQRMSEDKPKTYPVLKDNRLVGVIPRRAVLQALVYEMENCKTTI